MSCKLSEMKEVGHFFAEIRVEEFVRVSVEIGTMSQIRTPEMGDGGNGEVKVLSGSNSISQWP